MSEKNAVVLSEQCSHFLAPCVQAHMYIVSNINKLLYINKSENTDYITACIMTAVEIIYMLQDEDVHVLDISVKIKHLTVMI